MKSFIEKFSSRRKADLEIGTYDSPSDVRMIKGKPLIMSKKNLYFVTKTKAAPEEDEEH